MDERDVYVFLLEHSFLQMVGCRTRNPCVTSDGSTRAVLTLAIFKSAAGETFTILAEGPTVGQRLPRSVSGRRVPKQRFGRAGIDG